MDDSSAGSAYRIVISGGKCDLSWTPLKTESPLLCRQVWQRAAEQMFFSLGVSWGGLVMFGSYNKFNHKVHIDAMVISSLDFLTSIIASVAVFSILGSMARSGGVEVGDVVKSGQNLAFIAFPEAIGRVPGWQLWSILFFLMLYTLGLDSEVRRVLLLC